MQRRVTEEPLDTGFSFWPTNHAVHGRHSSHEYNAFAASALAFKKELSVNTHSFPSEKKQQL